VVERKDLTSAVQKGTVAQINIEVLFQYNSATLTSTAEAQLSELAIALSSPQFKGSKFVIAGHTDAKGEANYNQTLSEKRASSVRASLVQEHGIRAPALLIVGYGEEQLKLPKQPEAAENRRVQIINLGG
jgi:outer membrane protein OmpA-like peptidoglycan-associated protein